MLAQVASETLPQRLCQHLVARLLLPSNAGKGCQRDIASDALPAFDDRTAPAIKCWPRLPARHCLIGFASIRWQDCYCHGMLEQVASETLLQRLCQHLMAGLLLSSNPGTGCPRDIASEALPAFDGRTTPVIKCWQRLPARHCLRGFESIGWQDRYCYQMLAKVPSKTLPQRLCQHSICPGTPRHLGDP